MRMSRGGAFVGGVVCAVFVGSGTAPAGAVVTSPPAVSSLSDTSGALSGHDRLVVRGSGFTGVVSVLFGGTKAGSVHVVSSHVVTLVVPAHAGGRLDVRVVTSHGTSAKSRHDDYTYVAPPSVASLSLNLLTAGGGLLTVSGSEFTHVKKVLFGKAVGAHVRVLSSRTLTVNAPAHTPGLVDVRVVTAYGTSHARPVDRLTYFTPTVTPPPSAPVLPPISPLTITTPGLPGAERGQPYSSSISVSGGTAPYTITASGLPDGVTLSAAGRLSGTTFAAAAQYQLAVKATDAAGRVATSTLPLGVRVHPGQLFGWGLNGNGQVGNGLTGSSVSSPTAIAGLTNVVQVVGGNASGYALRADGTVWDWGDNSEYQLGDGTTTAHPTPQQVPGLSGVVSLAAGAFTAYALLSDGTLLGWGEDSSGQVGDNTNAQPAQTPVPVQFLKNIVQIVAGNDSAYALDSSGNVWAWGANDDGQLGIGSDVIDSALGATQITSLTGIKQLAAKQYDAFALKADGTVVGWGRNSDGEIGDTSLTERDAPVPVFGLTGVTALADADYDTFALTGSGTVLAWGRNAEGESGDGTTTTHLSPSPVPGLTGVQTITAGAYDCYATHPDGSVSVWGGNSAGEVGDGTLNNRLEPGLNPALAGMTALATAHQAEFGIR